MTEQEKQALQEALSHLLGWAKYWGMECTAKEAMKASIGLGGGFTMRGDNGFHHCAYYTGMELSLYRERFSERHRFTPAMYMPIAEAIWEEIRPPVPPKEPEPGTQLALAFNVHKKPCGACGKSVNVVEHSAQAGLCYSCWNEPADC